MSDEMKVGAINFGNTCAECKQSDKMDGIGEVISILQRKGFDASQMVSNLKAMDIRPDYYQGVKDSIDLCISLLNTSKPPKGGS